MEATSKLGVIGAVFYYAGVTIGILCIIMMIYITVKQHTRQALADTVKGDYGKVKERSSGLWAKAKEWRRARLQKKLDKYNS